MKSAEPIAALRVLWVDDDLDLTATLSDYLDSEGYAVECAYDLAGAAEKLAHNAYDLVLVDLALPDGSGLSLIRDTPRTKAREFVVMTGQGSVKSAVEALRHQVFDYLIKPVELGELRSIFARVRHARDAAANAGAAPRRPGQPGAAAAAAPPEASPVVGSSASMQRVKALVQRAAGSDITVFIQGESGTGKEVVARSLHQLSPRAAAPFVAMNCGAISPTLIASELFGHEKGSFTGAHRQHKGIFERAAGGTLLLDEITEMPLDLQATLLRVLETGSVVRVGGTSEIPVNVRVIAATNRDPMHYIEQGRFRLDLFYRLQVFPIELPALRERPEDIVPLAQHFLALNAASNGRQRTFSAAALELLLRHNWPGNARELRNVVERACLLSSGTIEPDQLLLKSAPAAAALAASDAAAPATSRPAGADKTLRGVEQDVILATLQACGGNKTRAAAQLGISVKTLYNKLKRFEETGAEYG